MTTNELKKEAYALADRIKTVGAVPIGEIGLALTRCDGVDVRPQSMILVDARSRNLLVRALKKLAAVAQR